MLKSLALVGAAVVVVVSEPTRDVSLALEGAAVVVVSEPTRDVGPNRWLLGAGWCPEPFAAAGRIAAGDDHRRARTGRRWARCHWGQT